MLKQNNYLTLGVVMLVVVLIFSLPPRATARLKLALGSLFLPLLGLANTAQQLPVSVADAALTRRELLQQVGNLRRENDQLKVQSLQAGATARENDQLRLALGWQRQMPWKLKLANVVLRDPANWWRTVEIDLGARDGHGGKSARVDGQRPWSVAFPPWVSRARKWFCWATRIAKPPRWSKIRRTTPASSAPAGRSTIHSSS
ncbi:MAG: hypothetical protein WDM80_13160 [Limisphaerales bacterium]